MKEETGAQQESWVAKVSSQRDQQLVKELGHLASSLS